MPHLIEVTTEDIGLEVLINGLFRIILAQQCTTKTTLNTQNVRKGVWKKTLLIMNCNPQE